VNAPQGSGAQASDDRESTEQKHGFQCLASWDLTLICTNLWQLPRHWPTVALSKHEERLKSMKERVLWHEGGQ
jgi:hypothetical protein